ncbi:MAG: pyridoxamine 5'-phosphate oxidase family protein [Chloroflexota bacterium]|nr:MAG: pyridoxamine 5'-phosphate oxidase family protein [Chloroflexota bacterium]
MSEYERTRKNRIIRHPERGAYDKGRVFQIIDEALICHVAFVQDGQPFVIPTLHARDEESILLHGASSSRLMRHIESGHELSLAFTLVDGLVLARSVFSHSVNYRSVVLFGRGKKIASADEKSAALERFTERIMPGRWADARPPTAVELKATSVATIPIELASAKIRQGPPMDDEADLDLPVWAGVVPIRQAVSDPEPDPQLRGAPLPDYIRRYVQNGR